jgi:hypothetical protein
MFCAPMPHEFSHIMGTSHTLSHWHATCFPVFQREQKPGLRFRLPVKFVLKHEDTLMNRKSILSLLLATIATLIVTASVMVGPSSAQAATAHNNKIVKTTVNIRTAIKIADTTLSPGKYRVKITPAFGQFQPSDSTAFDLSNPYGDDFNPPYEEVVVLTVRASLVDLRSPAASTELVPASGDDNEASTLEIRGGSTEYVFGAMITSAAKNH